MKALTLSKSLPISRLSVKASCPVCAAVKHFQETLSGNLRAEGQSQLCNFHAWLLARSAPAEVAASVFLNALKAGEELQISRSRSTCIACEKIREEEAARLREVTNELEQGSLTGTWMKQHARFCLPHLRELKNRVSAPLLVVVEEWRKRNIHELEAELQEFVRQSRHGEHSGGGVLGRAAEFLVAQRGISD